MTIDLRNMESCMYILLNIYILLYIFTFTPDLPHYPRDSSVSASTLQDRTPAQGTVTIVTTMISLPLDLLWDHFCVLKTYILPTLNNYENYEK